MRRQFVSYAILGLVAGAPIIGAPALGEEPMPRVSAPVAVQVQPASLPAPWFRDEAAMVVVGAALLGLAAAVRRAA
jgi:hypothetical protein